VSAIDWIGWRPNILKVTYGIMNRDWHPDFSDRVGIYGCNMLKVYGGTFWHGYFSKETDIEMYYKFNL